MLRITDLSKSYGAQKLFEEVSFSLGKGERCGLVGRNGEGKTTLFRLLLDEEHPDTGTIIAPRGYRTGHLGQHLKFTKSSVVEEGCLGLRPDEQDQRWRVESILSGLGFSREDFDRVPSELSGGFHIRLAMTKVLVSRPDLLLLDEPTNYLDIMSVRWLQRFLRAWPDEVMIITHDRGFMDSVTTHTLGIHRKRVRKVQGGTQKLYAQLLAEEEIHESTRRNIDQQRKHIQSFIDRFRAKASKATLVQSRVKLLEKMPELEQLSDIRDLDFRFTSAPFPGKTLMEVRDLAFGYVPVDQAPPLIEGVSFTLEPGDRIAVIGKNGRGKSTLLKLIGAELTPWRGELKSHPSAKVGYFGQTNIDRLAQNVTVEAEVASVNPTLSRTQIRGLCGVMMFDGDKADKLIQVLSGGEKSRVLIAKLLAQPSNVLLLDEPTSHLDVESVEALSDSIEAYQGAVVLVTHSETLLRELATKLVVFQAGKVEVFLGTYDEFLERRGWVEEAADGAEPSKSVAGPADGPARASMNPKERRALRSQVMGERTKAVGPLKKRVDALEAEIIALEARIESENHQLVEASTSGDGARITTLARSVAQAKTRVDELFAELEEASVTHDRANTEFDERLKALD